MGTLKKGLTQAQTITPELVLGDVSKAFLFDLLIDRARAELGERASDYACMRLIGRWSEPIAVVRGDRAIDAGRTLDSAVRSSKRNGFPQYVQAYEDERSRFEHHADRAAVS